MKKHVRSEVAVSNEDAEKLTEILKKNNGLLPGVQGKNKKQKPTSPEPKAKKAVSVDTGGFNPGSRAIHRSQFSELMQRVHLDEDDLTSLSSGEVDRIEREAGLKD